MIRLTAPIRPLAENEGYLPEPFTIADYRKRMSWFDISGGAVVSGSFQGTDQSYLKAALAELGEGWVGVTRLDLDATDGEIIELDRIGVRALRFSARDGRNDRSRSRSARGTRVRRPTGRSPRSARST